MRGLPRPPPRLASLQLRPCLVCCSSPAMSSKSRSAHSATFFTKRQQPPNPHAHAHTRSCTHPTQPSQPRPQLSAACADPAVLNTLHPLCSYTRHTSRFMVSPSATATEPHLPCILGSPSRLPKEHGPLGGVCMYRWGHLPLLESHAQGESNHAPLPTPAHPAAVQHACIQPLPPIADHLPQPPAGQAALWAGADT